MSAAREPDSLEPPWHDQLARAGVDALWAYSRALQRGEAEWPDALLLLGDQVYADEVSPATLAFIKARRDTSEPPGEQVADFEEYTRLYRESWSDPDIRWLLSTVPSAMIFDDHDVHDDWNISWSWVEEMRAKPWWDARITGAFMAYWIYQHVGNLSPPELAEETMLELVKHDDDAGPRLREAARKWDRESAASRWAYYRDFGDSRLLVVDSRAARVLADGRREMVDEEEWDWIVDHSRGAFDHLVIASTLPVFMPAGIHHLEAWNEAVCHGRWGKVAARLAERLRRGVDLEHWAAFGESFDRLCGWLRSVATGEAGTTPPASIVLLGGDVHMKHLPYHESDHVLNLTYNALLEGVRLEDIELRRNDEAFLDGLGAQRIPDPTTSGDFTRRFEQDDILELMEITNSVRQRVWNQQPGGFFKEALIDIDGTIAPTFGQCKAGMALSYKGIWGYAPLVISLANPAKCSI